MLQAGLTANSQGQSLLTNQIPTWAREASLSSLTGSDLRAVCDHLPNCARGTSQRMGSPAGGAWRVNQTQRNDISLWSVENTALMNSQPLARARRQPLRTLCVTLMVDFGAKSVNLGHVPPFPAFLT